MGQSLVQSQPLDGPLTLSAIFLVLSVKRDQKSIDAVKDTLANVADFAKNVGIRASSPSFACTVGIGSDIWPVLTDKPKPSQLHPFKEFKGATHSALSTPGDLLFHIRANRQDLCFEFEDQVMRSFGDAVDVEDEVTGFRYFDARDLLGFVDGTANPAVGDALEAAAFVNSDADDTAAGGTYVVVQKYLHNLKGWKGLRTESQEDIIGRTKMDNVELPDAPAPDQKSHKTLASVDGHDIVRFNMPFGSVGAREFGTYFIGYAKDLWVTEKMLENMFIGNPPGKHDRILDYSTAVTGVTFFAPSAALLGDL